MTNLNNEICDPSIDELSIEEMDAVTGGDSAILQLAKLAGAAAVYAGGGHFWQHRHNASLTDWRRGCGHAAGSLLLQTTAHKNNTAAYRRWNCSTSIPVKFIVTT
jgi:hypothetical protein